jgi:hypothetical protein
MQAVVARLARRIKEAPRSGSDGMSKASRHAPHARAVPIR